MGGQETKGWRGKNLLLQVGELLVVHTSPALFTHDTDVFPPDLLVAFDFAIFLGEARPSDFKSGNMVKVLTKHGKGWVFQKDVSFSSKGHITNQDLVDYWVKWP